ncbi:hypothetical protein [Streptomyces sp. NPDC001933]|uniref:hypothetical protein n=1 Tax=Streptomyces sp. NPDC001933 TaxID=3364626 RepID=UPI00367964E6
MAPGQQAENGRDTKSYAIDFGEMGVRRPLRFLPPVVEAVSNHPRVGVVFAQHPRHVIQ